MAHAIFRDVAKRELRDAARWYEDRSPGLGTDFVHCITDCVELIRNHPDMFPRVYRHVRQAVVKHFPYVLLYYVEDGRITIISVFHSSRDPETWKRRL